MKKLLMLLLVASAILCRADPDLRVVVHSSSYLPGLADGGLSTFSVSEWPATTLAIVYGDMPPGLGPVRRLLWFNLQVENVGDMPWNSGNSPLTRGALWYYWFCALGGFASVEVLDTNGDVLRSRLIRSPSAWDNFDVAGVSPPMFHYPNFGLSPGWAMWDLEFVDVTGLNGDFVLQVSVDPVGLWGLFSVETVPIHIDGFNATLR